MSLVTDVYSVTQSFSIGELYGLTNQMRRSAISIPSNIAEGYGRNATGDYKRFLQISLGSLFELQTQIEIARNFYYLEVELFSDLDAKTKELDRMLISLIKKIK